MTMRQRMRPTVADIVAVVVVAGIAVLAFLLDDSAATPLSLIVGLAAAAVLLGRRRWPIPIFALCLAGYAAAFVLGLSVPGLVIAVAIALFGVAVRTNRLTAFIAGLIAIAVIALLGVHVDLQTGLTYLYDTRQIPAGLTVALATATGDATRSRRELIDSITERAERAEQTRESEAQRRVAQERLSIARDLHDAVAHQISVISLNAGVASAALESRPDDAREALSTIRAASRTVLGEIGELLQMLRSEDTAPTPGRSPQPGLDQLDVLIAGFRHVGLEVRETVDGDLGRVVGSVGVVAYKVIQEGLTNAHKHAFGHRADLTVRVEGDAVEIAVVNTVPVRSGRTRTDSPGHGLAGLRERVAAVGGTASTGEREQRFRLAVTMPVRKVEK